MQMKKAQINVWVNLFMLLVVAAAVLWFAGLVVGGLRSYYSGGICQLSAFTMAQTKALGFESAIINDLKCETRYRKIQETGVYAYDSGKYRKDLQYKDFKEKKEHYIQKVAADEMQQCWHYLGQGTIDPFGDYDESAKCVICSQIEFDEEIRSQYKEFGNFHEFLQDNYIEDKQGTQISYWNYLTNGAEGDLDVGLITEPQSVVFVSIKPDKTWNVAAAAAAGSLAANGCEELPGLLKLAGETLERVPAAGRFGLAKSTLRMGGPVLGGTGRGIAATCRIPVAGSVAKKAGFFAGTAILVQTAGGKVEPRLLGVELMPTANIGTKCDKLY